MNSTYFPVNPRIQASSFKTTRTTHTQSDQQVIGKVNKSSLVARVSNILEGSQRTNLQSPFKHKRTKIMDNKPNKPNNMQKLKTQPDGGCQQINLFGYCLQGVIGRGTFGTVYAGYYVNSGMKVGVKKVLQDKKYKNRQLEILSIVKNENLLEMTNFYFAKQKNKQYLYIIMNYYPQNLSEVISNEKLTPTLTKILFFQILKGLNYLSTLGISHRDIKPQNLLVDLKTSKIVICDFGSAKKLVKGEPNLSYICSRFYRSPELIFGAIDYSCQIDMWSAGCVLAEMINGEPIFMGDSQIYQLLPIIKVLGTPTKEQIIQMNENYDWKQFAKVPKVRPSKWTSKLKTKDFLLLDLVSKILQYSPKKRLSPAQAIMHPYFDELRCQKNSKQFMQQYKSFGLLFNFSPTELTKFKDPNSVVPNWYNQCSTPKFLSVKECIFNS